MSKRFNPSKKTHGSNGRPVEFGRRFWKSIREYLTDDDREEVKHAILGLLFLKQSSDLFEQRCLEFEAAEHKGKRAAASKHLSEHAQDNPLRVPARASWRYLVSKARSKNIARYLDRAMRAIARKNKLLSGIQPVSYRATGFDTGCLQGIIRFIDGVQPDSDMERELNVLAAQYSYLLFRLAKIKGLPRAQQTKHAILTELDVAVLGQASAGTTYYDLTPIGTSSLKHPKTKPFLIHANGKYNQREPAVAFDGKNFLVVWWENRYTQGYWLLGCRISPTGKILDPGGFLINKWGDYWRFKLATGKHPVTGKVVHLVVFNNQGIRGALIDTDGKVSVTQSDENWISGIHLNYSLTGKKAAESKGIPIFHDSDTDILMKYPNIAMEYPPDIPYTEPDVAFNGKYFVVTCRYVRVTGSYNVNDRIIARLVDTEGNVERDPKKTFSHAFGEPITTKVVDSADHAFKYLYNFWRPRIVAGGNNNCLLTWNFTAAPGRGELWGVKMNFTGTKGKVGKPQLISSNSEPAYGNCAMAADGKGGFLLAWHDMSLASKKKIHPYNSWWPDLFKCGIKSPSLWKPLEMTKKGFGALFVARSQDYYPRVGSDGQNYLVTWDAVTSDIKYHHPKLGCLKGIVVGAYVTGEGQYLESFFISPEDGAGASNAAVAFGTNRGLLVYERTRVSGWDTKHQDHMLRARFVAPTLLSI